MADPFVSAFGSDSGFGGGGFVDAPAAGPLPAKPSRKAFSLKPAERSLELSSGSLHSESDDESVSSKDGEATTRSWPYVRNRSLFPVLVTPEKAHKVGWLLEEVGDGIWKRRWCMLDRPGGHLSLHDSDTAGAEATVIVTTGVCAVSAVKVKKSLVAADAYDPAESAQPGPDPEPKQAPELEAEAELGLAEKAEAAKKALADQAAVLNEKYKVEETYQMLSGKADSLMKDLDKKYSIAEKAKALKESISRSAESVDEKYGLAKMATDAKDKAYEAAGIAQTVVSSEDDTSDSGSEHGSWGGDDPLRHQNAFRIDVPEDYLGSVVGARAKYFTLDPTTETGQQSWISAIAGDDVIDSVTGQADSEVAVNVSWLPRNRRPRTAEESANRDLLDFGQDDIEQWVAKKAAKTVAERLVRGRATVASVEALDEIAMNVKSGATKSAAAASEESTGLISKAKGALKDAKDSAVDSAKSTAKDSVSSAIKGDAAKAATAGADEAVAVGGVKASTKTSTATGAGSESSASTAATEGGDTANVGSVRDAAFIGAFVGGATQAVSAIQENRDKAAETSRLANVVAGMSLGHLHRLVSDKTGRSIHGMSREDAVICALEACEIDLDSITDHGRIEIAKAALFGAASGGAPAAVAAAATKQLMLRGAGMRAAGVAGSVAAAVFDIGKDARKMAHGDMDKADFKKKSVGHLTSSAAGAAGAMQGAAAGAAAGPVGSLLGAVIGGMASSLAAGKIYEVAMEDEAEVTPEDELIKARERAVATFADSEVVQAAVSTQEPLKTLVSFLSSDELWRYLSDRGILDRIGGQALHENDLRELTLSVLRPDGCLCLDEAEISLFDRAHLCRLLLDAGIATRDEFLTAADDELRVRCFDAYGPGNARSGSLANRLSPSGVDIRAYPANTGHESICVGLPHTGIQAKIRWTGCAEGVENCIAISNRQQSTTFVQQLNAILAQHPAAVVIVNNGELVKMSQYPLLIPCATISADATNDIQSLLQKNASKQIRATLQVGTALFVVLEPEPELDAGGEPGPGQGQGQEQEQEQERTPKQPKFYKFDQILADEAFAAAFDASDAKSTKDDIKEGLSEAADEVAKSAKTMLLKKFKKGKEPEAQIAYAVDELHVPSFEDCKPVVVAIAPFTTAIPTEKEPKWDGCIVVVPHTLVPSAVCPWHVAFCVMKAGGAGVIFSAPPGQALSALKPDAVSVPCAVVSEETGSALAEIVSQEEEPDDMFAPIPLNEGEDEHAVLTAGLGLWVRDLLCFAKVSLGHEHAVALTSGGAVFCWGSAAKGRLGLGSHAVENQAHPVLVEFDLAGKPVKDVAAGHTFSYAVLPTGTLFAWGCNDAPGLLGVGDTIERWEPSEVMALRNQPVVELAVQHNTTIVVCQCTDVLTASQPEPKDGIETAPVVEFNGTCAFSWGNLEICGKGTIRLADRPLPVLMHLPRPAAEGETLVSAAAGRYHGLLASSTGAVFGWGRGRSGRLGLGQEKEQVKLKTEPQEINSESFGGTPLTRVFAQDDHSFGISPDGELFAWGCNDFPGKLGVGDTKDRFTPCKVEGLPPLAIISGKLGVDADGKTWKVEKNVEPYSLLPEGQTLRHVCAAMGRAAVVSEGGRLWIADFGRDGAHATDDEETLWASCRLTAEHR